MKQTAEHYHQQLILLQQLQAVGAIQAAQGGKFKAGFLSGFSSGVDVGTQGYGGFVGRTVISGIVGGTASAMGGGKFSNGAMSGAFVHMFNGEMKNTLRGAYKNTSAILSKMKNGDVAFGKRALGRVLMVQMGKGFDAIDQEILHEQVFYKTGGTVHDIGFSDGQWLADEGSAGYVFSEIYPTNNLNYVLSAASNFNPSSYSLFGCNCQSFSTAVANRIRIDQGY